MISKYEVICSSIISILLNMLHRNQQNQIKQNRRNVLANVEI